MRKVVCINTVYLNKMSLGKVYEVFDDNDRGFLLRNDDGAAYWFFKDNFKEVVDKVPKQKIKVLCVDLDGCSSITKGKFYEALDEAEDFNTNYYQLVNDEGNTELYRKTCFVVPEMYDVDVSGASNAPIKPPLGLKPRKIYWEELNYHRRKDIIAAIQRRVEAKMDIPVEWCQELIDLVIAGDKNE